MGGLAAAGALAAAVAASAAAARPGVSIAPIDPGVVRACGDRVETALRRALGRSKRIRLVSDAARAGFVLEVLECSHLDQGWRTIEYGEKSGLEKGRIVASELEAGIGLESVRTVILLGRVRAGSRFVDVGSAPDDADLEKAAESLRRDLEKAVKERGRWLEGRER